MSASSQPPPRFLVHPDALGVEKHPDSPFVLERGGDLIITSVLTERGIKEVCALPLAPGPGRPFVYCPFCGRRGSYRANHATPHFAHDHGEKDCLRDERESVLHRRAKFLLVEGLRRLRERGAPLQLRTLCHRCKQVHVREVLSARSWTTEALEQPLPATSRTPDVVALAADSVAFFFEVCVSNPVDARKAAEYEAGGTLGIELHARSLFDVRGVPLWHGQEPLEVPRSSWHLERAPAPFFVCTPCRVLPPGLEAVASFAAALERADMKEGREFSARLAEKFSVRIEPVMSAGFGVLLDAIRSPEALRALAGQDGAERAARNSHWPSVDALLFEGLDVEAGPWEGLSVEAVLRAPYDALIERIRKHHEVDRAWLALAGRIAGLMRLDVRHAQLTAHVGWQVVRRLLRFGDTATSVRSLISDLPDSVPGLSREGAERWLLSTGGEGSPFQQRTKQEEPFISMVGVAALERSIAREARLRLLGATKRKTPALPPLKSKLTDEQLQAVALALSSPFCVITGGPGTGKTTVVSSILHASAQVYGKKASWVLAAPTHKAVQRLCAATGISTASNRVRTLHAWLRQAEDWRHEPPFGLIVDEAGFVGVEQMQELLKAARTLKRVVLVGDPQQLPSISFGAVLEDLLNSRLPSVRLTVSHRASDERGLRAAARAILQRKVPKPSVGVRRIPSRGKDLLEDALREHKRLSAEGHGDTQIIAPTRKLVADLNKRLGILMNPAGAPLFGTKSLRVGDRVVCTDNLREWGLFNGQMGVVEGQEQDRVVLIVEGTRTMVPLAIAEEVLMPAYAITVHKSQGSEWDNVVVVLGEGDTWVDQKLLFTAATRSRQNLSLVGPVSAFGRSASYVRQRVTLLGSFLDELLPDSTPSAP